MPETFSLLIPIVIATLTLLYLSLYGQRSIAEYRRERRAQIAREQHATTPILLTRSQFENLPAPDYADFVGRREEVEELRRLLLPYPRSQHSVIALDGLGGIGKSALALHVARDYVLHDSGLPADERFDAVIWTSAKEALLTATGAEARPWRDRTLEQICETIAGCLEREDITRAPVDRRLELVRKALRAQRTLLIIDNMEAIDDETVYAFLRELPAPTKALITTRTQLDVAMTIHLGGLSAADATKVFRAQFAGGGDSPDDRSTNLLVARTGGLPLAMVWAAARMRLGDTIDDVLDEVRGSPAEALTSYSFGSIWGRLSENSTQLAAMRVAAQMPAPVTAELVEGAIGAPDIRSARVALNDLARFCLLTRQGNSWKIHPLVRASSLQRIPDDGEEVLRSAAVSMVVRLRSLIGDERDRAVSVNQYGLVDPDRENILFLVEWCCRRLFWTEARDLVAGLGYYLHARGLWSNAVHAWELGAIAADKCADRPTEARFRAYLGYMASFMGDSNGARFHYAQAVKLIEPDSVTYQHASLIRLAAYLARDDGDATQALRLFDESLSIMTRCANTHGICRLTNDIAETQVASGRLDDAETMAERALAQADAGGELIERVRAITVLASASRMRHRYEQAAVYADQARAEALTSGWWEDAGKATLELAYASWAMQDRAEARTLATEAERYFERIGSARGAADCRALAQNFAWVERRGRWVAAAGERLSSTLRNRWTDRA